MAKGDPPDKSPPRPPSDCSSIYLFSLDQITAAGNVERVRQLHIGAIVEVRLDPQGRAAVYSDDVLLGWPSRYASELEDCLRRHHRFPGRIVDEGGLLLPAREVQVTGVAGP